MIELHLIAIAIIPFVFWWFGFARSTMSQRIRMDFLFDVNLSIEMYRALPPPESMIYNPLHWHRWTKRQWVKYVESLEDVK